MPEQVKPGESLALTIARLVAADVSTAIRDRVADGDGPIDGIGERAAKEVVAAFKCTLQAHELIDVTSLADSAPSVLKGTQDSQPSPGRESVSSDRKHPRPVEAEVLGPRVLEALGLPPMGVLGFSLHFEVGEVVRARVEFAVDREAKLEPLLREFVLVPR